MRNLRAISACCALAAFVWAGSLFGQAVSASIVGTITDASSAVVANARVTITETETGVVHTVTANESGNYSLLNIPPGRYQVAVEMAGFKKEVRGNVEVQVDTTTRVDMQLSPGAVNETIEVSASAPALKADRADITTTISEVQLQDLPMGVNRNFQSLLGLAPGTTDPTFQHSQFFNSTSSIQMNTNGQFRMANNFQVEGIDNNERTGLLQILVTPAESIQQVDISTGNHDLELGRGTGAVVNVQIKSGTNQLHGAAYEYLMNSAFDARLFFNPSVGHIAYNMAGGDLGGPIKHNKLFFFGLYQRAMDHEANANQTTIPDAAFRAGNLSSAANGGFSENTVYDPATGDLATGAGRSPFPGNIIPANRINPISAKILSALPLPNEPITANNQSNDYFALLPFQKTTDHVDSKVDWQVNDANRFSVRFSFEKPVMFQAPEFGNLGGPAQGAFEGSGVQRTYSTGINWDRTVTPTLIMQTRVGVAYYNNVAINSDYGINDASNIGIPGANLNLFTSGMTTVNVNDFSSNLTGYSASLPWTRAEANIDFVNTWTKIAGNHSIKFGVDIRRIRDALLQDQTFGPRGEINFKQGDITALCTVNSSGLCGYSSIGIANDMAEFLLDLPSSVGRDVNTYFPALHATQIFSFIGDRWAISPKFTLDLGVRWEIYPPFTPQFKGGFSNYDPTNNTLVLAGVGNNPMNLGMENHFHYLAPRVGMAYRLSEKTVVRGGIGTSYTSFPDNTYAFNFPVRSNNQYLAPGGTFQNSLGVAYPNGQAGTFEAGIPSPDPVVVPSNGIIANPDPTGAYFFIPRNFKNPYIIQWNLAVQRTLPGNFMLDAAYVGSHGVNTITQFDMNAGFIANAGANGQPEYKPYGRQTNTKEFWQGFSSNFQSLQVRLDRRFHGGFLMTNSFTWQKAMDYQSGDDGGPADWYINFQRNYARADFDRTLNLVQSFSYRLPWGPRQALLSTGTLGKIIGGWQIAGVTTMRSGMPLTFTGNGSLINAPSNTETPNLVAPLQILHGIGAGNPWFSKASFAEPLAGTWGALGRAVTSGPGEFRLDANLSRNFIFRERYQLQVRADAFNVTNTPIFSNPTTSLTSSNFGYILGTISSGSGANGWNTTGRALQLGAVVRF